MTDSSADKHATKKRKAFVPEADIDAGENVSKPPTKTLRSETQMSDDVQVRT